MITPSKEEDIVMDTPAKKKPSKRAKSSHKFASKRKRTQSESTAEELDCIAKRVKRAIIHIRGKELSNVVEIVMNTREARLRRKEERKQRMDAEQVSLFPDFVLETIGSDDKVVVYLHVSKASVPIPTIDTPFLESNPNPSPTRSPPPQTEPHKLHRHHKPIIKHHHPHQRTSTDLLPHHKTKHLHLLHHFHHSIYPLLFLI